MDEEALTKATRNSSKNLENRPTTQATNERGPHGYEWGWHGPGRECLHRNLNAPQDEGLNCHCVAAQGRFPPCSKFGRILTYHKNSRSQSEARRQPSWQLAEMKLTDAAASR